MLFSGGGRGGGGALSKCFKLDIAVTFISKITTIYSIINLKRTMRKLFYLVKIDNSLYPGSFADRKSGQKRKFIHGHAWPCTSKKTLAKTTIYIPKFGVK